MMPTHDLHDEETVEIDVPPDGGVSVANLSDVPTTVYIDHFDGRQFSAITGERKLAVGPTGVLTKTRAQLGFAKVRVGARGREGSLPIAKVTW